MQRGIKGGDVVKAVGRGNVMMGRGGEGGGSSGRGTQQNLLEKQRDFVGRGRGDGGGGESPCGRRSRCILMGFVGIGNGMIHFTGIGVGGVYRQGRVVM